MSCAANRLGILADLEFLCAWPTQLSRLGSAAEATDRAETEADRRR